MALQDVRRTEGSQGADGFAEEVDRATAQRFGPALHTTAGQNGTVAVSLTHRSCDDVHNKKMQLLLRRPHSEYGISVHLASFAFTVLQVF